MNVAELRKCLEFVDNFSSSLKYGRCANNSSLSHNLYSVPRLSVASSLFTSTQDTSKTSQKRPHPSITLAHTLFWQSNGAAGL